MAFRLASFAAISFARRSSLVKRFGALWGASCRTDGADFIFPHVRAFGKRHSTLSGEYPSSLSMGDRNRSSGPAWRAIPHVGEKAVATGPPALRYEVVGVDHPEVLQPEKGFLVHQWTKEQIMNFVKPLQVVVPTLMLSAFNPRTNYILPHIDRRNSDSEPARIEQSRGTGVAYHRGSPRAGLPPKVIRGKTTCHSKLIIRAAMRPSGI